MISTLLFVLLASTSIIIASPLNVPAKPIEVTSKSPILNSRATESECPGHINIYSALLGLANPSAACSRILPTKTITVTARPSEQGVKAGGTTSTTTSVVLATSTVTSINVVTQTVANAADMGITRVSRTMWTTITVETGTAPSSCISVSATQSQRKRSLEDDDSADNTASGAAVSELAIINAARPSALQAFAMKNIIAGCSCLSISIPTITITKSQAASSATMSIAVATVIVTKSKVVSSTVVLSSTLTQFAAESNAPLHTTTITVLSTTTAFISIPTPSLFYLLTQPFNAYISVNMGGYDLVLSSISTNQSESPSTTNQAAPSCPASNNSNYTTTTGSTYTMQCSVDHYGYDLSSASTTSFESCMTLCSRTTGCEAVSFVPSTEICYMKSSIPSTSQSNSLVWSAILVSSISNSNSSDTSTALDTLSGPSCPDCPNGILPGLQPASPATLWTFDPKTSALMIANVSGDAQEYAGYTLSDFDNDEDFYQQDLFGPERPAIGGAECCYIGKGDLLECAYGGQVAEGSGTDEVVWAVCYAGAVFHGTRKGLSEYEAEMAIWVEEGQGRSPECVVVDVMVVPASVG